MSKTVRIVLQISAAVMTVLACFFAYVMMRPQPVGFPILEYHMVATYTNDSGYSYNVPPQKFREQMRYLQQEGYTTITLLEFMKAKKGKFEMPDKPIILTFDDGYDNNYYEMLPILEEFGMKANVFMVTNKIGNKGYLTWEQLREMQKRGIEVGSHTANHLPLTSLDEKKQDEEVYLSKLLMEWNGINTVFSLSYPNGKYNEPLTEILKEREYLSAVTGDGGLNNFDTDPYLLKRVNIPHPHFGVYEFRWRLFKAELMARIFGE